MRGIYLPLKYADKIDFTKPFQNYVAKRHGKQIYDGIEPTLKDMASIRNSLDFQKMSVQLNNDYRLAADFEGLMINYLRYVYLIDNFFSRDFSDTKNFYVPFQWSDSFNPKKKQRPVSNSKYELVSILYNLAVVYYTEGIHFASLPNNQEKLKGIAKLRNALWCINEIKNLLPNLMVNPADIPSDLNLTYITLLQHYFIGLTYGALIELLEQDKKNGDMKMASVHKIASKNFSMAYDISIAMKDSPMPNDELRKLQANLHYNQVMHRAEAMSRIADTHLINVDEEILKGHMGFAVSYLRIAKTDIDSMMGKKGDVEYLNNDQKNDLLQKAQIVNKKYDNCLLKNQKVYKQKEYAPDQLPEIPEDNTPIGPMEPKDIKSKVGCESKFECFLSPEIMAIKNEFMNMVSMKAVEIENSLKNIHSVKNKLYAEAYVNYLLSLEGKSGDKKMELPPQLKQKIDKFRKNGAFATYEATRKNITAAADNCGKGVADIKNMLAQEKDEDEAIRKQFPHKWTRPYSEQVNQEYVFKLRDLEQKFYIAQNTDKDIFKKYDQNIDWMMRFSQSDDEIISILPKSTDGDFIKKNQGGIHEVSELNKQLNSMIDMETQRKKITEIYEDFIKNDFIGSYQAINQNKQLKESEFEKILAPYKQKLAPIEASIQEAYPLLDNIVSKSKQVNSTRSDADQNGVKVLEEMNLAITVINGIYDDFSQGANFYMNLGYHLNTLQKVTKDFVMARNIEKEAHLQELNANANYQNINTQNQKPYFQENQFPQGSSVFVPEGQKPNNYPNPSQPYGGGGGGGGNTQTQNYKPSNQQFQGTQMYNPNQQGGGNQFQGTQMYNPNQQGGGNQYQQTQMYNPNQQNTTTQMYNPNNQQGGGNKTNFNQGGNNNQTGTQMGYMPINDPNTGQPGPFQGLGGNLAESTLIFNPFAGNNQNQGKK